MDKFLKNLLWVFGILAIVNLLVLDFVWMRGKPTEVVQSQLISAPVLTPTPNSISPTPTSVQKPSEDCSSACLSKIQEEVKKAMAAPTTPSGSKTTYISIGSSGSTSSMSWADIPGTDFYFDLADYPQVKGVRWEASLQSFVSSNPVYARLYDVTNKRAVDGSDLTTTSSTYQYLRSSDLTIWRGNNLYRIQARGSSGNTANLNSPRLKIIFE